MKKFKKFFSMALVITCTVGVMTGCGKTEQVKTSNAGSTSTGSGSGNQSVAQGVDTSKEVKLVYYLWGSEGVANKDILSEINKKLKEDINATIEVKYIDWGDTSTKYPLLFASGENFDMSHASTGSAIPYGTLATQGAIVDITDMLEIAAPKLKAEIPDSVWETSKVNGRIYGVPSLYSEFTPAGFVTRRDLREKYGIEVVNSIETMEEYLDKALVEGEFVPLNGNSSLAMDLYKLLIDTTGTWICEAPGIPTSEMGLVAKSAEEYQEVFHPAFTDEFEDFAVRMREWADKGYWTKDVLSSQQSAKDNFMNGLSAAYITHMADWTGQYGAMKEKLPGIESDFWCFAEKGGKIKRKMGVENSTVISMTSKNPERALMAIEKFMTDESYYNLIQYGIEGRQYEVIDGVVEKPATFDSAVDGGGFSVWSLRSDKFNIPYASEDPRRYELNEEWNKNAIDNPYVGFNFDNSKVTTELAAISNVNAQLGIQILLGKTTMDPKEAVAEYRNQLQKAGVDTVIEEVKSQLAEFSK
ncbi:extracellular solute-binding protein [Niameybacter massiliensis]|uniref:extracellular solute-binding protein n=1 Tax=Niameybacter massiliensis TaxID=1658108 RepID=UPI0006B6097B|nr:extracellular solute-binding protein [Niameybacter massiliensis]